MKPYLVCLALAAALLGGCGPRPDPLAPTIPPAPVSTLDQTPTPLRRVVTLVSVGGDRTIDLTTSAGSEEIRRALLDSHTRWKAIWMDALITEHTPQGDDVVTRVQIWVDRPAARFRVVSGPDGAAPASMQLADGESQVRVTLADGAREEQPLMADALNTAWQPPVAVTDSISPHPLEMEIDSLLGELVFPQGLAQRGGAYTPEGMDEVAGQAALMASWALDERVRTVFWIDADTGVVLRQDTWNKNAGRAKPDQSIVVRGVVFNPALRAGLFALDGGDPAVFIEDPPPAATPTGE